MYQLAQQIFNEYQHINDKVDRINNGGCGIFAERLYDLFVKLGHKPELVIVTDNAKKMAKRVKGLNYKGYACVIHIVVKLNEVYMDSEGICTKKADIMYMESYRELCTTLDIDTLRAWNGNAYQWNNEFNRRQIPTITRAINKIYKKFGSLEN